MVKRHLLIAGLSLAASWLLCLFLDPASAFVVGLLVYIGILDHMTPALADSPK